MNVVLQYLAGIRGRRGAWLLWLVFAAGVTVVVVRQPDQRTVTPVYRQASADWWAGRNLYEEGQHGFLYLPASAILYTPFTWPPKTLGEVLWRWVILGLYASSVWRLARLASPHGGSELLAAMTLLSIPAALGGARNGQMNMPLAGLMIHAAVDLARLRWWRASLSLCLAFALKPLAFVMVLLAAALYPPMAWRLALGVAAVLFLPFLWAAPAYAARQYELALAKMGRSTQQLHGFHDVGSLLRTLGIRAPDRVLAGVRAAAALGTLALGWIGLRRWGGPRGAILILSLAATYLMLFNPRNETNSYLILSPVVAVFAAWALFVDRRPWEGWALAAIAVGLGSNHYGAAFHVWTNYWLKAVLGILFLGYLAWLVLADRPPGAAARATPGPPQAHGGATGDAMPRGRLAD